MRFLNIHPEEVSLFAKGFVCFLEAPGLTGEGASRVGSKYND